jgi:hypothetical protein
MNEKNEKPDAEQCPRVVLWHLAEIRATVGLLQARVLGLEVDPLSPEAMDALLRENAQIRLLTEAFFYKALRHANIAPSSEFPPPFRSGGGSGGEPKG